MYSVSTDEELYHGQYESIEEAITDSAKHYQAFFVGECASPTQPEHYWSACDWLDNVSSQDEYDSEWADGWDCSTKEQREELETKIKAVMAKWLDRHNLRPKFWLIENPVKYVVVDGKPMLASEAPS